MLQTVPWPGGVEAGGVPFVARVRGTLALEWGGCYNLSLIHPPTARAGLAIDGFASPDNATAVLDISTPRTVAVEAVFWWVGAPPATPPPLPRPGVGVWGGRVISPWTPHSAGWGVEWCLGGARVRALAEEKKKHAPATRVLSSPFTSRLCALYENEKL